MQHVLRFAEFVLVNYHQPALRASAAPFHIRLVLNHCACVTKKCNRSPLYTGNLEIRGTHRWNRGDRGTCFALYEYSPPRLVRQKHTSRAVLKFKGVGGELPSGGASGGGVAAVGAQPTLFAPLYRTTLVGNASSRAKQHSQPDSLCTCER